MMQLLTWLVCGLLAVPLTMLIAECLAGCFANEVEDLLDEAPPFTVLMPAHNEALGIESVIRRVQGQMRACDRLVVVADNCTDDTAAIAMSLDAIVVERHDATLRGKSYALAAGQGAVRVDAGEVILILDADCVPKTGALFRLATIAMRRQAAVQGAYILMAPPAASPKVRLSCFAFLVKNLTRQRGLQRLSGAALLQGSGMAFPAGMFGRLDFASGSLVEDLEMGLELLLAGEKVLFDPGALFVSAASTEAGTVAQRRRWEHGMVGTAIMFVPRLLKHAFDGRRALTAVALDLLIPPTVPLVGLTGAVVLAGLWIGGPTPPIQLLLLLLTALGCALLLSWHRHGKPLLQGSGLAASLSYMLWKLPIAVQYITRRQRDWLRTERER